MCVYITSICIDAFSDNRDSLCGCVGFAINMNIICMKSNSHASCIITCISDNFLRAFFPYKPLRRHTSGIVMVLLGQFSTVNDRLQSVWRIQKCTMLPLLHFRSLPKMRHAHFLLAHAYIVASINILNNVLYVSCGSHDDQSGWLESKTVADLPMPHEKTPI